MSNRANAQDVQDSCWFAMKKLHEGTMSAGAANAVATNAREILRAARVRMNILQTPGLPADLMEFAKERK